MSLLAVVAALTLIAAACGKNSSTTETTAIDTVSAALSATAEATSYRLESSIAQTIRSTALGLDTAAEIDPKRPSTVAEVTPDGSHIRIDLGAFLGPLTGDVVDSLELEIWVDPDMIVIDTTSYSALLELDPSIDLGPFRPGIVGVDVTRITESGSDEMVAALGGQTFDLAMMGAELPAALRSVERSETEPNTFRGIATYADILRSQGADVESVASGIAAGIGPSIGVDAAVLVDIYVEFYESVDADVVITLSDGGLLQSLSIVTDLSGIYGVLFDDPQFQQALGASDAEVDETAALFADTYWRLETYTRFTPEPGLALPTPPSDTEDRTEEYIEFMESSGVFDS